MFLKKITIKNFRGVQNLSLEFREGVNVLIGENNTGKTAIIDALRLSLGIGKYKRELYVSSEDYYIDQFGKKSDLIEFDLVFSDISDEEKGIFIEMLAIDEQGEPELQLHVRYAIKYVNGEERYKFQYWGGEHEGQNIPSEIMELFYFVSMGALRDARRDLSPKRGSRLGQLFTRMVTDKATQKEYAQSLSDKVMENERWNDLIDNAKNKINEHLNKTTITSLPQHIDIEFLPYEFKKIVDDLKMTVLSKRWIKKEDVVSELTPFAGKWEKYFDVSKEGDLKFKEEFYLMLSDEEDSNLKLLIKKMFNTYSKHFGINQNGMGYNNLIYIATVLGDLLERKGNEKESYISLLIEEPEAHLHPQLQSLLFEYLRKIQKKEIQIFLTSHSPTITAKTDIDSVIVLHQSFSSAINATSLASIAFGDEKHKEYVRRFLDVTKSQMFFSNGIILVEGISEVLLLPTFAEIMDERYTAEMESKGQKVGNVKYNFDKNGVEIVNIGGVAFEPFAKLFNSSNNKERVEIKCAIITDSDELDGQTARAQNVLSLKSGLLDVWLANKNLEYELYINNEDVIVDTYKEIHPNFKKGADSDIKQRAIAFANQISSKTKAPFAQLLAYKLQENDILKASFIVPEYIQKAIKWVVSDD